MPEVDVLAVGNPALDSPAPVGGSTEFAILDFEGVVMLASGNFGTFESRSDLETLGSGNREHSMGQFGFELVEDGLSQA